MTTDRDVSLPRALVAEYAGTPRGRRYDLWREELCRNFCRIDAEPSAGDRISCKIDIVQVASLAVANAGGTSGRFLRSRGLLSDCRDDFVLVDATLGGMLVVRQGRSFELRQSQMCLMELNVEGGVCLDDGSRFTTTRIPRRELLSICPNAEDKLYKPLSEGTVTQDLVRRYYALATAAAPSLDTADQNLMARHMIDLAALLLRPGRDDGHVAMGRGYSKARLRLIQTQVLNRLSDTSLTFASIAKDAGLSQKQMQRLFARMGTTFSAFVLDQRLLLARQLLSGPDRRHDKIGTIAFNAGFGDLSYFNRAFRRRFGMTPSEWRDGQAAPC